MKKFCKSILTIMAITILCSLNQTTVLADEIKETSIEEESIIYNEEYDTYQRISKKQCFNPLFYANNYLKSHMFKNNAVFENKKTIEKVNYNYPLINELMKMMPEDETEENGFPLYDQNDYPNVSYGKYGTVASHGCGITCLSMIATYFFDAPFTPDEMANRFGDYNTETGSYWILFEDSSEQLGLPLETRNYTEEGVIDALKNNQPVIALQSEGLFTNGGHFIVLVGLTEDGKIIVNDPNGNNYTANDELEEGFKNGFTPEQVFKNGGPYWIYSAKSQS